MRLTTDILKVALEWVEKNWSKDQSYNLTMTKTTNSRPPVWAIELIREVKEMKQDIVELKEFVVEQKAFNAKVETFIEEQKIFNAQVLEFMRRQLAFNELLLTLPTIKKEISDLQSK